MQMWITFQDLWLCIWHPAVKRCSFPVQVWGCCVKLPCEHRRGATSVVCQPGQGVRYTRAGSKKLLSLLQECSWVSHQAVPQSSLSVLSPAGWGSTALCCQLAQAAREHAGSSAVPAAVRAALGFVLGN